MRILLSILALLLTSPAYAADKMSLILDWFINPDHGPIIVAQQKGYFKDVGLEVEIIPPADPADPPKLAAAGKADLAVSYQPQLHLQVSEGLPLKRVGTLIGTPLNCLLALKDGPIQKISDLKGKKVGFSVPGFEEALLGSMLKSDGLSMDDVEVVNVNWSLVPSVLSKQVSAVIGSYRNFDLNQMEIEGVEGRCFYPEENGVPAYDELVYVANPDKMDTDKIKRFLAATEKATQYIVNEPNEAWKLFASYSKELQDELNEKAWVDTWPRFTLSPSALDHGRYARYETFLKEAGLIKEIKPVNDLAVDLSAQ